MTPVTQTKLVGRDGYGTCYSACLASLMDIPEHAVPFFTNDEIFYDGMEEETKEIRNQKVWEYAHGDNRMHWYDGVQIWLKMLGYTLRHFGWAWKDRIPDDIEYVIVTGKSPRGIVNDKQIYHAVIYKRDGNDFIPFHDPYPTGEFLDGDPTSIEYIVKG